MRHDQIVYLKHILDAAAKITEYLQGVSEDVFQDKSLIQDGVIRQLEIVGEAVRHLSPEFRKRYPDIPWQDIAGMRDKLIHNYFGVDLIQVWSAATEDLPALEERVREILESFGNAN